MKNRQGTFLLIVILAVPAFAFADNVPGHSKGANKYVTFSEGFSSQQDIQGNSAQCNFLLGSSSGTGSSASSIAGASSSGIAKGETGANLGAFLSTGMGPNTHPVKLVDFGSTQGASSDKDKGKGPAKHHAGDSDGNGPGVGSGTPSSVIAVAEPASQSLLLFGLAGLGMLFHRRKSLTNAI
jgi:hypothetical protein